MVESKFSRPSRVTVPARCHSAAAIVFAEMKRQGVTYDELSHYSGVLVSTMKAWRTNNRPGLETLEATLGHLGWDFLPVPRPEHLPPRLVEELDAMAERWGPQLGELRPMLIAAAARVYEDLPLTAAGRSRRPDHREAIAA